MKKNYLVISIFLSLNCSLSSAQSIKSYQKKSSVISLGYGVNNIWKQLFKESVLSNYYSSLKGVGPVTLIYEYGFTSRISAGVALGYSSLKAVSTYGTYRNDEKLTNFSVLLRGSYHIINKPKWDGYLGGGAGYYKFNYTSKDNSGGSLENIKVPGAFGWTGHGGIKYYFNPHFAGMIEAGFVAGSYGQLGVAYKF
ncbi:MAG: hypothetical protein ABIW38_15060 [Ferruginibacter sp.]